jgi:bifunctional non-homologous end joining protein LigD
MLAKETKDPFDSKDWLFEIKWDGYRAIAEIKNDEVKLYSRNGITFEKSYPVIVNELKKIDHEAVIDGEIVVLNDEGQPDFQLLQDYESNTHRPLQYYAFDLLSLDSNDTCDLPLLERKELLEKIIIKSEVIKYSDHFFEKGISFFEAAKQKKFGRSNGKKE